jgi:hypothetical protein
MKAKVIGILAAAAIGFSAQSYADYDVTVDTSACNWNTTSSGMSGGPGVGTVYWYNASLVCPSGPVATKSWWTSTSGQSACSIYPTGSYKLSGNCNSYSIYVTIPSGVSGANCAWSSTSYGSSGWGNTIVYFYAPIGQCNDKMKIVEYRSGVYYGTTYSR